MPEKTARLIELFSAIQGEGLNVGTRQIFIRFALCDLRCHFCDSVNTWIAPDSCRIEQTPGLRDFETHSNPVELSSLLAWINRQNQPGLHDSISITGGEPLLHAAFLAEFLPRLQASQVAQAGSSIPLPIYLETGGHRPAQLAQVLPYLDLIGMDWKLPSVSGEDYGVAHREFLRLALEHNVPIFVKLIIAQETQVEELQAAAAEIRAIALAKFGLCSEGIPVFLQPVTPLVQPHPGQMPLHAPLPEQVLAWQGLLKAQLPQVRVIPQTHKFMNQI